MLRALLLGLLCSVSTAEAQTDVFPDLWITDARVEGMAVLGDTVFVAGRFDYVGPPTGQLAVLDKTTGEADISQPRFSALGTSGVLVTLPDGAGGYYVGGAFSVVAGQPRHNLARVLPDGTLDPNFSPDPATTAGFGAASVLAVDRAAASPSGTGVLYVGGDFATIGGQSRTFLAAVDAATGVVLPFDAQLDPPQGSFRGVFDLLVQNGVVYVSGGFETIAGQPRPAAVALDGVTGALLPWNVSANGSIRPVAISSETVYIAGGFTSVNGQPRIKLAEVSLYDPTTGGGALTPWTPEAEVFGEDFALTPNALWATSYSLGLRRIDRMSGAVVVGQPGCGRSRTLAYDPSAGAGTLYTGCEKPTSGSGDFFPYVVGLNPDTGRPNGFEVMGASERDQIQSLAVDSGRILVGGDFVTFGAGIQRRNGLAAFDLTTGRPTGFGTGDFPFTEDLALAPDGRFLYALSNTVGGLRLTEFDLTSGTTRAFISGGRRPEPTAMTAPPSPRPRLDANPRVENAASALVVTDDGAGGGRVCLSSRGVACYDRASADLLFYTPMPSVTAQAENNGDLLYLPPGGPVAGPGGAEGTLYVAAPIEEAPAGTRRPAFVAVDYATGAVLPSWDVGFGPTGGPEGYTLALLDRDGPDGPAAATLYLGGDRQWTVQGQPRQELMAVDPQTAALRPWAPRVSAGPVLAMAAQSTADGAGAVYVGGSFRFVNDEPVRYSAAAFDAASGSLLAWDARPRGPVLTMLLSRQHEALFLGGIFGDAAAGGTGHAHLVAVTLAAPLGPTVGEDVAEAPRTASLALAGPNPLRSRTTLAVSLPEAQAVNAALYDVLGRRVAVLHEGVLPAGVSRLDVDTSALPAGVYVARVTGVALTASVTLTVVR